MSYCVHCGVELDATASFCPLCHTRVLDRPTGGYHLPKPFPTRRGGGTGGQTGGGAAHYRHARLGGGVLRRTQSVSAGGQDLVAVRHRRGGHAVAVAGAAAAGPGMHLLLRLLLDIAAVALYVYLISVDLNGGDWYLAWPPQSSCGAGRFCFCWVWCCGSTAGRPHYDDDPDRQHRRLCVWNGVFVDRWLHQLWSPSWSLVVLTICIGMVIPLIIIRRVPALREEARRRFHL